MFEEDAMFEDDASYFRHRAEIELERAQEATQPEVVSVHYRLAEAYFDKVASFDLSTTDPV